jgi:peptidoglycan/xylan/chitin deacetylase (PgdA/CDA1 family)
LFLLRTLKSELKQTLAQLSEIPNGTMVTRMDNNLYDYTPITERPALRWPNGARVAFYVGLNIEHFKVDRPGTSIYAGTANLLPDPLNYGWRDYGLRVGFWRILEALDAHGIRASALLNTDVASRYPQIIEAGKRRNWAWLAHGKTNSLMQQQVPAEQEPAFLRDVVDTVSAVSGKPVRGWLGPGLSESFDTPRLLRELGLSYVLDWTADDQPFALNVPGMLSVPYSLELNDINMFVTHAFSGEQFVQTVKDQLDQLFVESEQSGRVMALALHPFVIGQAFRVKYLRQALEYVARHDGVWLATADEIAAHYANSVL